MPHKDEKKKRKVNVRKVPASAKQFVKNANKAATKGAKTSIVKRKKK